MRHANLRDATRLAAEKKVNKLETRLTPGEKSNRKRMAQVATVCSVAPWERTAAEVLYEVGPDDVEKRRPAPHDKRVWASVEQSPRKVIRAMFDEARRRDPDERRRWVVLVDGEPRQLRAVKAGARRAAVKVTLLLDVVQRPRPVLRHGHAARGTVSAVCRLLRRVRGVAPAVSEDALALPAPAPPAPPSRRALPSQPSSTPATRLQSTSMSCQNSRTSSRVRTRRAGGKLASRDLP